MIVNKLLLGSKDDLDNIFITEDTYLVIKLDDGNYDININVEKGVYLKVLEISSNVSNSISYTLNDDSEVVVNSFGIDTDNKIQIYLNGDGCNINYNVSIINYNGSRVEQQINHHAKSIVSRFINHCVNYNDDGFRFLVNSNISKDSDDCDSIQDNKIINMNSGKNTIMPNLTIDNDSVDAEHSAYIGNFDSEVYFYFESRGLSRKIIDKLLINSFLIGYTELDSNEKTEVIEFFKI